MAWTRFKKGFLIALLGCGPFLTTGPLSLPASAEGSKKHAASSDKASDDKAQPEAVAPLVEPAKIEPTPPPWNGIRSFLRSHDRIVIGDLNASSALGVLRQDQAKLFENIKPEAWDDIAMRQAASIYVLAGGSVTVLKPSLSSKQVKGQEEQLLKGILAYGTGHATEAEALLTPLNALDYTATLGGHLALAQAILITPTDPKKALQYLDTARLLMPGSLVEEAALRHTLSVAAKLGDRDHFLFAAGSYFRRFANSSYASMFRRQLVTLLVQWPHGDNIPLLTEITHSIPSHNELGAGYMLIAVAEQAIYAGNFPLARAAIDMAFPYYQGDSDTRQRLLLYHGIALIFSDQLEAGIAQLKRVNRPALRTPDSQLLTTALDLAKRLYEAPKPGNGIIGAAAPAPSEQEDMRVFPVSATRKHAADLLAQTNTILEKAK